MLYEAILFDTLDEPMLPSLYSAVLLAYLYGRLSIALPLHSLLACFYDPEMKEAILAISLTKALPM